MFSLKILHLCPRDPVSVYNILLTKKNNNLLKVRFCQTEGQLVDSNSYVPKNALFSVFSWPYFVINCFQIQLESCYSLSNNYFQLRFP